MWWKKPADMKYTDMCIYIDENRKKLLNAGEYPEVENTIYNYLWLLVKALAIKKCMFNNFQDYDPYAFYAAHRLFYALRKNLINEGKVIKGKKIRPIKSILNYTKTLLYPMKIEYQNEAYREVISEEFITEKFNSFAYKEQLKDAAKVNQGVTDKFWLYLEDSFSHISEILDKTLERTPFKKGSAEYKHVRMSIMLNCFYSLKLKKKFDMEPTTIILWKLPKSMSSYLRIIMKEFYTEIKKEILECYAAVDITDEVLEKLISNPEDEHDHESQY